MKKNLIIYINTKCNLRCNYCFVNKENKVMSFEQYVQIIEKYKNDIQSITFFGGEPLLNFTLIKQIIEYNYKKKYKYFYVINTNGIKINDEVIRVCKKYNISLTISLDGNVLSNKVNRFDQKIFEQVLKNIRLVKKEGIDFVINYVITPNNLIYIEDSVKFFYNEDFMDIYFLINYDTKWTVQDIKIFEQKMIDIVPILLKTKKGEFMKIYPIWNKLYAIMSGEKIPKCIFGEENLAISPDGKAYPCVSFLNKSKYEITNENRKFINDTDISKCKNCKYESLCVNNCMCRSCSKMYSDINVNCETEKIFIQIANKIFEKIINYQIM